MKKYGIFLAFPPKVALQKEGLGRYLIEFLKGAQQRGDVLFVIACPSWMRQNLKNLFESSGIHKQSYELIGPRKIPFVLLMYEKYAAFQIKTKRNMPKLIWDWFRKKSSIFIHFFEKIIVEIRNPFIFIIISTIVFPFMITGLIISKLIMNAIAALRYLHALTKRFLKKMMRFSRFTAPLSFLKGDPAIFRLFQLMLHAETSEMLHAIEKKKEVIAWYCPTAFWPAFNKIKAPRLLCVPDVVLTDFPIGFSAVNGDRFLKTFKEIENTISNATYLVTYSEHVKWQTLVQNYKRLPNEISVVKHGLNRLDELISITDQGTINEIATDNFCRSVFSDALYKIIYPSSNFYKEKIELLLKNQIQYIFYASQFRPNKNIISLLKAYNYLLKKKFIGLKLILTGTPEHSSEITTFIKKNHLEHDVLCLHNLSAQELAACYRLANLAVNPSLSEGGCPFTFTEALSVNTPVVMARIPVTEEVIFCPNLQESMLFDPYDWKDMAHRIAWGLENKDILLKMQKSFYDILSQRTWANVVDDYIEIFDRISGT